MTYELIKYSSPGWEKSFEDKEALIDELRLHICSSCLVGPSIYVGENGELVEFDHEPVVDVEYQGEWYYCRDLGTLLGTSCGCEYGVEKDGQPYWKVE